VIASVKVNGTLQTPVPLSYTFTNVTSNQTIDVKFAVITYTITAVSGSHGSVSPSGKTTVNYGDSQTYTINPDSGYETDTITVNGVALATTPLPSSYTFSNVTSDDVISVTFVKSKYKITATAGPNGSISPSGITTVDNGDSQTLTITPNSGYQISTVTVDGTLLTTAPSTYTFSNVSANHTINVKFVASTYTITATAGANGSISPAGITAVNNGASQAYTITPNTGYVIASVKVNGTLQTPVPLSYTFTNVTSNQTIDVKFAVITYTITAVSGSHGSVSPSGKTTVNYGDSQTYTINPDSGYETDTITVNGVALATTPLPSSYTFSNVTSDDVISVTFVKSEYKITATSGNHGSISPSGTTKVDNGASQTYTMTPDPGYQIATVTVNGTPLTTTPLPLTYTFSNVTANQTINVTFVASTYTITATTGANGSISPTGKTTVNYGDSRVYTFIPNTGYVINSIKVDGTNLTPAPFLPLPSSYTFTNVTANHTIDVTFAVETFTITATASAHGSISPSGTTTVNYRGSQVYTITPNAGYETASITVNGVAQALPLLTTATSTYDFTNVTSDPQMINVVFVKSKYKITVTAGPNGSVSPSGTTMVDNGDSQILTITPNSGYQIATVTVDGTLLTTAPSTYTFSNVSSNHTINVTFLASTYSITATAGPNGSISPAGITVVNYGASQAYAITPNNGYEIATIKVKGVNLKNNPLPSIYTFSNVTADQTISATFVADPTSHINMVYSNAVGNNNNVDNNMLNTAVTMVNNLQPVNVNIYNDSLSYLANNLYSVANIAIREYQLTPNAVTLQIAIRDVSLVQPYNNIQINGIGLYDILVNNLIQAVTANLSRTNNIQVENASQVAPQNPPDNSFSSNVAIDGAGNIYVSAPSDSITGFGMVYELQKNPAKVLTIAPVSPVAGDHFGRLFAVSGNTLAASSEPKNGFAKVYLFTLQHNQWMQQTILNLTTLTNISSIHQISLALSGNSVVIGLPEYGKYLVFDQNVAANAWQLGFMGTLLNNNAPVVGESVAANGNYIAIGAPATAQSATRGFVRILQNIGKNNVFNWQQMTPDIYSPNFNNPLGFGSSVAVSPGIAANTETIAIGSPLENNNAGAVYMMTSNIDPKTNVTTFSALQAVNLLMSSSTKQAGSKLALNGSMLVVGASPSTVMVYKLNNNQWSWAYTSVMPVVAQPSSFTNSVATDGTTVLIGNQNTSNVNCSDYIGSGSCPQSNVEIVKP